MQNGSFSYLFPVGGGVQQGCPLSSVIFVLPIDPLLWVLSQVVAKPALGRVCVCADDIGISLLHFSAVKALHDIFSRFAKISGLKLSAQKCIIILTSVRASDHNTSLVRDWLSQNAPDWATMQIGNNGIYLGFWLGPAAGAKQWKTALTKYKLRVDQIYEAHESPHLAVLEYNAKATTVLDYFEQLVLPPSGSQAAGGLFPL